MHKLLTLTFFVVGAVVSGTPYYSSEQNFDYFNFNNDNDYPNNAGLSSTSSETSEIFDLSLAQSNAGDLWRLFESSISPKVE